ncbi:RagB/SusD family nutrient uptake outer membrane protein [Ornithobacterium rhinotracheale]|uniref:RagB/SusD family nutrient uptake outer membrane protein n=1 Tax=Ornithobacterium rhinotracheale TaxID=28251 RepID=UPI00129C3C1E|nr:RagB/SusD family nutrient uptake outer membrane protein [Ornithobacterium rhinotracheale]MRJ07539.1 RagB/SusD family nutrient uptake outer membrane protein [Ornithobacterium rhinotracheale]UOH78133.1 RagB/SusD family nutrient uptake outer membrane protein [Ornithobacterium rhinotracheale]
MKLKRIIIGLAAGMLFTACNTDIEQDRQMSSNIFWKSSDDVYRALMGCYAYTPQDVYGAYEDGYADIVYCQYPWESNATIISAGNFNDGMNDGYNFRGIRRFNYFLDNVDKATMDEQTRKQSIAEVRVLRAWYYYEFIKKFGAMPLFKKYITEADEAKVAPTSEEEIKNFVISEIEEAIADLPEYPSQKSRIGKAAALAIKSRIHLFYNEYAQAAAASKQIMGMNYSLFKVNNLTANDKKDDYSQLMTFSSEPEKEKFLKGLRSYEQLFWEQNKENSEVIFNVEYIKDHWNGIGRFFLPTNVYGGWASITPTNNLIIQYWDKNGKEFKSPSVNERAERFKKGAEQGNWNEYLKEFKDRDTRLYATVLFPQAPWAAGMGEGVKFEWKNQGNASNTSKTGYNFRKLVDPTDPTYVKMGIQDFPEIRLAEVLITFAEAQNEASGPSDEVYNAINKLRERVGMPNVESGKSKEELRKIIRQERCIELAGEGFRWDDVRRWDISSKVMSDLFAINGGSVQQRNWEPRFKRLPYPRAAIDRNPNLEAAQKAKGY